MIKKIVFGLFGVSSIAFFSVGFYPVEDAVCSIKEKPKYIFKSSEDKATYYKSLYNQTAAFLGLLPEKTSGCNGLLLSKSINTPNSELYPSGFGGVIKIENKYLSSSVVKSGASSCYLSVELPFKEEKKGEYVNLSINRLTCYNDKKKYMFSHPVSGTVSMLDGSNKIPGVYQILHVEKLSGISEVKIVIEKDTPVFVASND